MGSELGADPRGRKRRCEVLACIHPGDAADKNLYDLPPEEAKDIPQICGSLQEALEELDKGRAFLTKGGVFSDDFIDAFIELKSEEEIKVRTFVHPLEYELYYSC